MRISDWSSDVCSSDLIGYLYGADEPAVIATGRWSIGGGDLPSGTLSIARNEDGRVTGLASFEPYNAEGARLALTPVRFSGGAGGLLRFATTAALSGPLAGGRVRSEEHRGGNECVSTFGFRM